MNSNHSILGTAVQSPYSTVNTSLNELMDSVSANTKISRDYRIDLTKAENGGFVIQINTTNLPDSWSNKRPKVYINKEIENLGRDIQNALMIELMKE